MNIGGFINCRCFNASAFFVFYPECLLVTYNVIDSSGPAASSKVPRVPERRKQYSWLMTFQTRNKKHENVTCLADIMHYSQTAVGGNCCYLFPQQQRETVIIILYWFLLLADIWTCWYLRSAFLLINSLWMLLRVYTEVVNEQTPATHLDVFLGFNGCHHPDPYCNYPLNCS